MGHPAIDNGTPFAVEPLFAADEEGRPIVVVIVKATYEFDLQGRVWLAEEQIPVDVAGTPNTEAPISSYKHEPDIAFLKPTTDVVLVGTAEPPGRGATQVDVGIKVGPVRKLARVFGDRFWIKSAGEVHLSRAAALTRVPLIWENAFGGQDSRRPDDDRPAFEPRNPVGRGFGRPLEHDDEHLKLPNIEDPADLITAYGVPVAPCGFGFTSPNWEPRARLAGTYDAAWQQTRSPLLPIDFDRRFFNAAAPGLIASTYLTGCEDVVVLNATPGGRVAFALPGSATPSCTVAVRRTKDVSLSLMLDTVVVDTDQRRVLLTWRGHGSIARGPQDVRELRVADGR